MHLFRAVFGGQGESCALCQALCVVIAPSYPQGKNGSPRMGLTACDKSLSSSSGAISLGWEPVPAETTILKFRFLLEKHHLGKSSSGSSTATGNPTASRSVRARSPMPRSSTRPHRPTTKSGNVTRACIKPRKATQGAFCDRRTASLARVARRTRQRRLIAPASRTHSKNSADHRPAPACRHDRRKARLPAHAPWSPPSR